MNILPLTSPSETFTVNAGEFFTTLRDSFDNQGTIDNNGDISFKGSVLNAPINNAGNSGTINNNSNFENKGYFVNNEGATVVNYGLLLNSNFIRNEGGTFVNNGELVNDKIVRNQDDGTFINNGTFVNNGTFGNRINSIFRNDGTFDNQARFNINSGILLGSGTFKGNSLNMDAGTFRPEGFTVDTEFKLSRRGILQLFQPHQDSTLLTVTGDTNLDNGAIELGDISDFDAGSYTLIDGQGDFFINESLLRSTTNSVNSFDTDSKDFELIVNEEDSDLVLTVEDINNSVLEAEGDISVDIDAGELLQGDDEAIEVSEFGDELDPLDAESGDNEFETDGFDPFNAESGNVLNEDGFDPLNAGSGDDVLNEDESDPLNAGGDEVFNSDFGDDLGLS